MAIVDLPNAARLPRVLDNLMHQIHLRSAVAMQRAARWGFTQAVIRTQRRRATAGRTFIQAWFYRKTGSGALVGNSAAHAIFVERGRRKGKMPPVSAIEAWIRAKGIAGKARKVSASAARKAVIGRGVSGNISGAKQRARLQRDVRARSKVFRSEPARQARHEMMIKAMALGIARKIKYKGTRGRFILRDLVPYMGSRYFRLMRVSLRQLASNPPR